MQQLIPRNYCHPLDKKSPVPVNHGRSSKIGLMLVTPTVIKRKNYTALRCIGMCLLLEISGRLYKWSGSW